MKGTVLDALMAELLGDVGKLNDQVTRLNTQLPTTLKTFEALNEKLLEDRSKISETFARFSSKSPSSPEKSKKAIAVAIVVAALGFAAILVWGIQIVDASMRDKKTAQFAWATGEIARLSNCAGEGWQIKESDGQTYCMPHPYIGPDGKQYVTGWRIAKKL